MGGTKDGLLNEVEADRVAQSVQHWVSHMFAPEVYYAYMEQLRDGHERLHEEIDSVLPEEADASTWVSVRIRAADTTLDCPHHPLFRTLPAPAVQGTWVGGWRVHRHGDGSAGTEAAQELVCGLLAALCGFGGSVTIRVYGSRPVARRRTVARLGGPAGVSATWQVDAVGDGVAPADRPTMLVAGGDLDDPFEAQPQADLAMTEPAVLALAGTVSDDPSTDTALWRAQDPAGFTDALVGVLDRLMKHPRLAYPVVSAAVTDRVSRLTTTNTDEQEAAYAQAAGSAAVLYLRGEMSLPDAAASFTSASMAATFVSDAASFITTCWQAHLGGYLLTPQRTPEQEETGLRHLLSLGAEVAAASV